MLTKLLTTIGCMAAVLAANPAAALEKGDRVTVVVPYSPGGGFDTQARLIAPRIESELHARGFDGVSVVVTNVRGGGGAIATSQVYGSKPDGTTLLILDPESSLWQQTLSDTVFDLADFTYLAQISSDPFTLTVRADMPESDFPAVVKRSATTPLLVATSGHGAIDHILPLIIQKALGDAGMELEQDFLFFGGTSDKIASMRRGESEMTAASTTAIQSFIAGGEVKLVLTFAEGATDARAKDLLGLPEEDFKLISAGAYQRRVLVAPPGMDEATRDMFREVLGVVLKDQELLSQAETAQQVITYLSGAEVVEAIESEIKLADRYGKYVSEKLVK